LNNISLQHVFEVVDEIFKPIDGVGQDRSYLLQIPIAGSEGLF